MVPRMVGTPICGFMPWSMEHAVHSPNPGNITHHARHRSRDRCELNREGWLIRGAPLMIDFSDESNNLK